MTYTDIMRKGIRNKYSLIKYHYTEYLNIYANGGVYFKPMYFEFPNNDNSFDMAKISYDFMLGSALKVSINTNQTNQNTTEFYFPANVTWCDLFHAESPCFSNKEDKLINMSSKAYDNYLHLRSGYIVPLQDA